ncbi:Eco57I restriction-modification methylase domain-containing protein [Sorangium sp. So ce124]|uniref:Eco57I restriction-modification methylase domain-containing protein n=1 Tax=Sorangium sp. So ce124 TaxID=3133280 RepID=UPI003F5F05E8
MKDRDVLFHKKWLGLAQPIEGLVFSVPALADAQIAPEERPELSAAFEAQLTGDPPRIRSLEAFFRDFLGYASPAMLVPRAELPADLSFYAAEGGQEIRPSFALGRGPFAADDPFAAFDEAPSASQGGAASDGGSRASSEPAAQPGASDAKKPWFALLWDLTETGAGLDLDEPESETGPWRYPPTAKLERLLRHAGVPVGFLFNGAHLRLVYAPAGESAAHLTFRVEHLRGSEGRPLLTALDLLLHARRAYSASPEHTLEGLLAESRRRQADVTEELAKQVFEAVETLVAGFEAAAARDYGRDQLDWLRAAIEAEGDHFYQGVLSVVLRLVFLLYAEDQALLPVEHRTYAEHLSLGGLYARLSHDAGAHPESMHHRFGAYGQLLALFRAVFFGVKHGTIELPPRRGRLFDPNTYPFLEGGLPGWTAAVTDPGARAQARPPSIDDGTVYKVLHRLVVFGGQRLSYRTLDVEQIGSVYESLMGYHVLRIESPAVRLGKFGVWAETRALRAMSPTDRARFLKETCGLNPGPVQAIEKAVKEAGTEDGALVEALAAQAGVRRGDESRHRASTGRLVLQPGEERRRTGSHYTPRSLTEKVVRRTVEPLLACLGEARTPEQILQLKICDPAMGSGAFLVAACRELAGEIVAAWTRQGELARVIEQHGDAHLHARRLVAQQCLYGVDKNAAAVELAKLSLWLVTLSRTLPFTFVDHALRHGDSLVGLDFRQIEAFHWAPSGQTETVRVLLRDALDQAVELRQQILALADHEDPVSQGEKRRLFEFSQQAIERVRVVADACVGAFFAETKDAAREKERKRRLALVETWLGRERGALDEMRAEKERAADLAAATAAREELEALSAEARDKLPPFHWWIEFPEVFFEERPDPLQRGEVTGAVLMEGVVGNPPFGGKNNIIDGNPGGYLDWLKCVSPAAHGNSDLSAHFFRRGATLLGENGTFGLIATNTIAQGDTRTTGLAELVRRNWTLYDATDSMPWPGAAAVTVSLVHGAHGRAIPHARPALNGTPVPVINSRLRPKPERLDPEALSANANSSFQGSIVLGMGFILTPAERDALVKKSPKNAERIFPYLGGEELNTSPTQSIDRHVISFGQMELAEAERWPDLIRIVREKVKPERDKNNREVRRKYWWRFGETAPALYATIAPLDRCLATSGISKHRVFALVPSTWIFSHNLYVFPLQDFSTFAVLQSRTHIPWASLLSSGLEDRGGYRPSDCFETFPFPRSDPRTVIPELGLVGEHLYDTRARFMIDTNQGLTKIYNAIKDPACNDQRILELRRLHEEMDRAVLAAYGWSDIAVPPYCPLTHTDCEALQAFEDEVIDRLYVLNAERAREEQRLGLAGKKKGRAARDDDDANDAPKEVSAEKKPGKGKKPATAQGKLF